MICTKLQWDKHAGERNNKEKTERERAGVTKQDGSVLGDLCSPRNWEVKWEPLKEETFQLLGFYHPEVMISVKTNGNCKQKTLISLPLLVKFPEALMLTYLTLPAWWGKEGYNSFIFLNPPALYILWVSQSHTSERFWLQVSHKVNGLFWRRET